VTAPPVLDGEGRRLSPQTARSASLIPLVVLGVVAVIGADDARVRPLAVAVGVVLLLAVWGVTRPEVWAWGATATRPSPVPALIGASAVVGTVALLLGGFGLDVRATTIAFGVIAVVGAFALPSGHRATLVVVALAGWVVVLPASGIDDAAVLVCQTIGAVLLATVAWRNLRSLELAAAAERRAAASAAERAALLATLLRLQSLEPDAVLEGVVDGAATVGFASVLLFVPEEGGLRLAAERTAPGEPPPPRRLGPGEGVAAEVMATGQTLVVPEYAQHPQALVRPGQLRGTVACPVLADGEVTAVLVARRAARGVDAADRETVVLLAEEAGAALARARRFAADAAVVAELKRLEALTQDFVSTVSHELRTPMTVIAGLGQTLQRRWDDLGEDRRTDLLRRIDSNAERLATMVRSLIDTSALERGEFSVTPSPVWLSPLVAGVVNRSAPLFEGYEVTVDVAADLVILADESLLNHVVENLLANVAQHTPAGTRVAVSGRRRGDLVEVSVTDDGPGIAAEDLPHVTERFYRAGTTGPRKGSGGLGLGLALALQILQAHGTVLQARSEIGLGTVFSFALPAGSATSAGPPAHGSDRPPGEAATGEAAPGEAARGDGGPSAPGPLPSGPPRPGTTPPAAPPPGG
jgi:signal transduction histidine kinase